MKIVIEQQSLLYDLLAGTADGTNIIQSALERVMNYLGAERISIFSQSNGGYELLNEYSKTKHTDLIPNLPDIFNKIEKTGYVILNTEDIASDIGIATAGAFRMYVYDHKKTFFMVEFKEQYDWSQENIQFIATVSNFIASIIIRNAGIKQLTMSRDAYETVLDNVHSYILVADPETNHIIFANKFFKDTFEFNCEGKDYNDYVFIPYSKDHDKSYIETYSVITEEWLAVTYSIITWINGEKCRLFSCYDITTKKNYEDDIKRIAFADHLTGLPNRWRCNMILNHVISSAEMENSTGYLIFIDMDDFKIVNDCYGHDYGDGVLISFAEYLKQNFGDQNFVFRFGGDEFVIIVSHNNSHNIYKYLDQLLERGKQPWKSKDKEFYCSLSIGVVPFRGLDAKSIIKYADIAMYQAKKSGKNNYVFYSDEQQKDTMSRNELEKLVRRSMKNDLAGFEIIYQPYLNLQNNTIGAEALLRMKGDNDNYIMPDEFIPLVEYLGFMIPLGEHVLRKSAELCKNINDAGFTDFSMTVNLSGKQFQNSNIIGKIEQILMETNVNPANIVFGIDETSISDDLDKLVKMSKLLHKSKVKIALDNFVAGNTSFLNLNKLPVDIVKLSPVFTNQIGNNTYIENFMNLVTDSCHSTGKIVYCNGVETEEQFDFCKQNRIDTVQGFFCYRPDTEENLWKILKTV